MALNKRTVMNKGVGGSSSFAGENSRNGKCETAQDTAVKFNHPRSDTAAPMCRHRHIQHVKKLLVSSVASVTLKTDHVDWGETDYYNRLLNKLVIYVNCVILV